jgi:hypothetical protein
VWKVPADDSGDPEDLGAGDGVAVHPVTGELLLQRFEKNGVRLYRVPRPGGPRKEVKVRPGALRLALAPLGARAIDRDGRVLVTATSKDFWFWRAALLDLGTGALTLIPVEFDGDIFFANWGREGKVLGMGYNYKSELWRVKPRP